MDHTVLFVCFGVVVLFLFLLLLLFFVCLFVFLIELNKTGKGGKRKTTPGILAHEWRHTFNGQKGIAVPLVDVRDQFTAQVVNDDVIQGGEV